MTTQLLASAAALAVLVWPKAGTVTKWAVGLWQGLRTPPLKPHEEPAALSYPKAIENLASVRTRLRATECFKEAEAKAVDVLTLALVSGSDK